MRLIDADKLLEDIHTINYADYNNYSDTFDFIDNAPTIEAEPVKHGKWVYTVLCDCNLSEVKCSNCDYDVVTETYKAVKMSEFKYCPNCGAKMEETYE